MTLLIFSPTVARSRAAPHLPAHPSVSLHLPHFRSLRTRFSIIIVTRWSTQAKYTESGRPEAQWQGPLEAVYLGPSGLVPPLLAALSRLSLSAVPPPRPASAILSPRSHHPTRNTEAYTKEASRKSRRNQLEELSLLSALHAFWILDAADCIKLKKISARGKRCDHWKPW